MHPTEKCYLIQEAFINVYIGSVHILRNHRGGEWGVSEMHMYDQVGGRGGWPYDNISK